MKKRLKIKVLVALLCILCASLAGVCYAYLVEKTDVVTNTFSLGSITCDIEENFDGTTKENVFVKNTSDVGAFIRTEIIVNWSSKNGSSAYADVPVLGTDYYMDINETDWFLGTDGYYYYKYNVNSLDNTAVLIEKTGLLDEIVPPDGYFFSVEVISTAIQSNPNYAVADAWKTVSFNGEVLIPNS